MAELGPIEARLADLKRRWLEDPSSRLFLQLAEEYRRIGRSTEALEILDTGLERNPGYTSALVAKGRCLVDLGRAREAIGTLQQVLDKDATHLVAAKLVVEAYLQQGDALLARRQLDLYTLINPSDGEIDSLRGRIQQLVLAEASEPVFPPPVASAPPPAAPAEVPFRPAAPARPPAAPSRPAAEPFGGLVASRRRNDLVRNLAAEAIFAPAALAPASSAATAVLEPPEILEVLEPPEAPATIEPLAGSFAAPEAEPTPAEPTPAEPLAALAVDLAPPSPEPAELEDTRPGLAPAAPSEPAPTATATLGELYLRQGHLDEAERIFSELLQAEPGSAAALSGLEAVAEARDRSLAPAEPATLLPRADEQGLPPVERKVRLLKRFLAAVRGGSSRDVS